MTKRARDESINIVNVNYNDIMSLITMPQDIINYIGTIGGPSSVTMMCLVHKKNNRFHNVRKANNYSIRDILHDAANHDVIKHLIKMLGIELCDNDYEYFTQIKSVKMVNYIILEHKKCTFNMLYYIGTTGNTESLQLLCDQLQKKDLDLRNMMNKDWDIKHYVSNPYNIKNEIHLFPPVYRGACNFDQVEMIKFIHEHDYKLPSLVCQDAVSHNSIKILKYVTTIGYKLDFDTLCHACRKKNKEVIKHAIDIGQMVCNKNLCMLAAIYGDLDMIKLLRSVECPWSKDVLEQAEYNKHYHIVEYAIENMCPGYEKYREYKRQ